MRRYALSLVFGLLVVMAAVSFAHSYRTAHVAISHDMNRALTQALAEQQSRIITPDTIRSFNSHLQLAELRGHATISVDNREQTFNCRAHCDALTVLRLSDQRASVSLTVMAMLWGVGCWCYTRRRQNAAAGLVSYGTLSYDPATNRFLSARQQPIHLTPMQHQLLSMFISQPRHELTKQEICDALWHKKPDATDTLYTLIRRLKPIVEEHSNLHIESDRGRSYTLTS